MRVGRDILIWTFALIVSPGIGLANGGGSMTGSQQGTPEDAAKSAYNSGVRSIKKAQDYDADSAKASSPEKSAKASGKAREYYSKALEEFIDAVSGQAKMYQAWNYIGFANRHLGNYDAALSAYAKALELNPNYPDAIEYRGEAYLGLNRVNDAKAAYMTLFAQSRPLADQLMTAMRRWTDARRADAQGVPTEALDEFSKWVDERSGIAAQTASLAAGARTTWK